MQIQGLGIGEEVDHDARQQPIRRPFLVLGAGTSSTNNNRFCRWESIGCFRLRLSSLV